MKIFENYMELAWAQRLTILLLVLGTIWNIRAARLRIVNSSWRMFYIYGAATAALISMYAILLLTEVVNRGEYAQAVQWLSPLLLMRLILGPQLHIWEEASLRRQIRGLDGTSPSNARDRSSNDNNPVDFHQGEGEK